MDNYSKYYPFQLTEDQESLISLVRSVAQKELAPLVNEYDIKGEFPMQVFDTMYELGLYAMNIPEEYGGLGIDHLSRYYGRVAQTDT